MCVFVYLYLAPPEEDGDDDTGKDENIYLGTNGTRHKDYNQESTPLLAEEAQQTL